MADLSPAVLEPVATFKIVLLGHTGVGKTSLLAKFATGRFRSSLMTTIGLDFKDKVVNVDGLPIKMRIWDTAGQERFETLTVQYLRGAEGVILVFDLTDEYTYDRMEKWLRSTINNFYQDVPVVVVGNKLDLKENRCVNPEICSGEIKLVNTSYKYFETSCCTGENVDKMFLSLGRLVAYRNGVYSPSIAGRMLGRDLAFSSSSMSSKDETTLSLHESPTKPDAKCCH